MSAFFRSSQQSNFANLNSDKKDIEAMFYIIAALIQINDKEITPNAVLALEGLTFYGPGKRIALQSGCLEALDQRIQKLGFENITKSEIALLETMSNLLSHPQLRFISIMEEDKEISLIGKLQSIPAFIRAVFSSLTARSAQSSCACLFIMLYEDFWRVYNVIVGETNGTEKPKCFPVQSENLMELIQKLVEIAMSFKEDEGGKAASMCLIIIWQCLQAERNFEGYDVSLLKKFIACQKELFVLLEMHLNIQNEQTIEQCGIQNYNSIKEWHLQEINECIEKQTDILAEERVKRQAATTGNMRSGNVRNGRVSSLDL
eukprot:EST46530.1 hypothetical protein SS50377_13335 [Spironucleus salmonicida]